MAIYNGISCAIFRWLDSDCTNSGLTVSGRSINVSWSPEYGIGMNIDDEKPMLLMSVSEHGILRCVPVVRWRKPGMIGPMFGGNYVGTSDSRFTEAVRRMAGPVAAHMAVPVFDRYEGAKQYMENGR